MQKMVKYTIGDKPSYAIMNDEDLAILRTLEEKNPNIRITSVKTYRRRSVR